MNPVKCVPNSIPGTIILTGFREVNPALKFRWNITLDVIDGVVKGALHHQSFLHTVKNLKCQR